MKKNIKRMLSMVIFIILLVIICFQRKKIIFKTKKENKFRLYYEILNKWIKNILEGISIETLLKTNGYKTVGIYGIGEIGQRLYDSLKNSDISIRYIVDQGRSYSNELIIRDLNDNLEYVDLIIVTPVFDYEKIREQLREKYPTYKVVSILDVLNLDIKPLII